MAGRAPLPSRAVGLLLLLAAAVLVYAGVWSFDFVNFDDDIAVLQNQRIRLEGTGAAEAAGAVAGLFRFERGREYLPIRDGSYLLDHFIYGGLDPSGFHLTNLILHLVNGIIVVWLAGALGAGRAGALWAGALFLLHPIQVESVAWIAGRKDLLAALFALASWHAHVKGRRVLSPFLFLLAGLSKATVVALPLVLFVTDWRRARDGATAGLRRVAPHIGVSMLVGILQLSTAGDAGLLRSGDAGPLGRLLLGATLPFRYLRNALWPDTLHLLYAPSVPDATSPIGWLAILALASCLLVAIRIARGMAGLGALAFFALLLPTLGVIPFLIPMADRYAYLPMAGLALLGASLVPRAPARPFLAYLPLILIVPLAFVSRREVGAWRDSESLWRREVRRAPERLEAWANLGNHYLAEARAAERSGDLDGAAGLARLAAGDLARSAAIQPGQTPVLVNWALAAKAAGDLDLASSVIEQAIESAPRDARVHYNAACIHAQAGRPESALSALTRAIELGFNNPDQLATDPDLTPLHPNPQYQALLQSLRK